MEDMIGKYIGRYHISARLGEGGMAVVYRAFDTKLERDVALKFIRSDMIAPALHEKMLKRFEREAKALAKFLHPNIVPVLDYGDFEGAPFLVMAYLPGGTLKRMTGKPMPAVDAARLLFPVARALQYAHKEKILHRDVKPANILITKEGDPMLSDFGIAKILSMDESTVLTQTGVGIGTPEYMAPEQWGGKPDERTDVYSLGVVFYELITGRRPYEADTPLAVMRKQMIDPLPHPGELVPDLDAATGNVLIKALSKEPENRYENMAAFGNALERLQSRQNYQEEDIPELDVDTTKLDVIDEGKSPDPQNYDDYEPDSIEDTNVDLIEMNAEKPENLEVIKTGEVTGDNLLVEPAKENLVFEPLKVENKNPPIFEPFPNHDEEKQGRKINPLVLGVFGVVILLFSLWIFGAFSPKETETDVENIEEPTQLIEREETEAESEIAMEQEVPLEAEQVSSTKVEGMAEVFTWGNGMELAAGEILESEFKEAYPDTDLMITSFENPLGLNEQLANRKVSGEIPDSWQVLFHSYMRNENLENMQPITWLYEQNGWFNSYPTSLIEMLSINDEIFILPTTINQMNILWYNPEVLFICGFVPEKVSTASEWVEILAALNDCGIQYPLIVTADEPWNFMFLLDDVLVSMLGPENYSDMMKGDANLNTIGIKQALFAFHEALNYSNLGKETVNSDQVPDLLVNGDGAYVAMPDGFEEYFEK
ncbi:MAG: protein kinase, partial [Anaerolineaceae bacterium]|nr:protein kinase [Anaerolineaceae bacterium]